jgi:transmembrane sensor
MIREKRSLDLPKLKLSWDERRTERLLERVHARLDRRKRVLRGALTAGALASVMAVGGVALRWHHVRSSATSSTAPTAHLASHDSIKLREGSQIEIDPDKSEIRVVEESPSHVRVDVVRGSGRYSVVPNPERSFEVRSGTVTVTVVGTEFLVEQRAEGTWVEVFRGKVRVAWATDQAFLAAGESGIFPPSHSATALPAAPNSSESSVGERDEAPPRPAQSPQLTQVYRSRVAHHDYRGAYAVLTRHPALAGDSVEELLVAADVARLSDHPSEALPYLQRVIREHPHDERAPLAAFTLGRTLVGLGRTQEAMVMFGRVRGSWPESPLAEDALVRQAEASSKLGDLTTARRLAEQYDREYPSGRRRSEVRHHAGLE